MAKKARERRSKKEKPEAEAKKADRKWWFLARCIREGRHGMARKGDIVLLANETSRGRLIEIEVGKMLPLNHRLIDDVFAHIGPIYRVIYKFDHGESRLIELIHSIEEAAGASELTRTLERFIKHINEGALQK